MSLGRLGLHCSFHICPPLLSYRTFRACGEIGRRARLRIWWFMPCRFESYQAHHNPPPTASQKPSGIFMSRKPQKAPESPLHLPHEGECSALVLGRVRLVRLVGEPKLRNQKSNKSSKNPAISGSRALPLYGGDGGGSLGFSGAFWRELFLSSFLIASADAIRKPADTIRKPADTIRIFSALQNLLIFSEEKTSNS